MSKYSIQCTITSVSVSKSQIKNLEGFVANRIGKKFQNITTDLIEPVVIKETDYPIINDRLCVVALITTTNILNDSELEQIKSEVNNGVGEYLSNQNIIYKTNLVSIFKL